MAIANRKLSQTKPSTRKEAAVSFLRLARSGNVPQAYVHIAPNFRHHNPYFPGDAASLAKGIEESAKLFPHKTLAVQRLLEEGDFVAVHSRVRLKPDGSEMALVHIFRFEGERIVELWDVGEPVPDKSPNENGMF
jgi:predicted SnoaL-like aldol condensation-catalyzing enzyme